MHVPLRRLLDRATSRRCSRRPRPPQPGGALALVETDGHVFVGVAEELVPVAASLRRMPRREATGETVPIAEGLRIHPLRAHGDIRRRPPRPRTGPRAGGRHAPHEPWRRCSHRRSTSGCWGRRRSTATVRSTCCTASARPSAPRSMPPRSPACCCPRRAGRSCPSRGRAHRATAAVGAGLGRPADVEALVGASRLAGREVP